MFIFTEGIGTFSRVFLTRYRTEEYEEYHALKIMAIRDIIKLNQVTHVNDERAILAVVQHPFIVQL